MESLIPATRQLVSVIVVPYVTAKIICFLAVRKVPAVYLGAAAHLDPSEFRKPFLSLNFSARRRPAASDDMLEENAELQVPGSFFPFAVLSEGLFSPRSRSEVVLDASAVASLGCFQWPRVVSWCGSKA